MYLASDEMLHCHQPRHLVMERRWKPSVEIAPNCPRCASSNTKFCYYNNYSLSQPRYFCKSCRRYWTKGGFLRNVPAGGGCRKSRRTKAVRRPQGGGSSDGTPGSELTTSDPPILGAPGGHDEPDIDMVAVFAKFVERAEEDNFSSPNQDVGPEDIFGDFQTRPSTSENCEQLFTGLSEEFQSGDHILQEGQVREFLGHEANSFGLQTMFSDELVQDPMWSDSTTLTNFSWQPMVQLQGFGPFSDDHSKFSTSIGDNWSLFDFPDYDVISRPQL